MMSGAQSQTVDDMLACPLCGGVLHRAQGQLACAACGHRFPQPDGGYLDLMVDTTVLDTSGMWQKRQADMETWYRDLIAQPADMLGCLQHDYHAFAPMLGTLTGAVLDIGGGRGVTRQFLPRDARYIVLEPSLEWRDPVWNAILSGFPDIDRDTVFVRGVGEHLPFRTGTFDAAVSFWSLNHTSRPGSVLDEIFRVVKPGGRFLAVLEDIEPSWTDLAAEAVRSLRPSVRRRRRALGVVATFVRTKLRTRLTGRDWPLQADHIRITDADMRRWIDGRFELVRRSWTNNYRAYELRRKAPGVPVGITARAGSGGVTNPPD